jgi:hypothetical protein
VTVARIFGFVWWSLAGVFGGILLAFCSKFIDLSRILSGLDCFAQKARQMFGDNFFTH